MLTSGLKTVSNSKLPTLYKGLDSVYLKLGSNLMKTKKLDQFQS